MIDFGLKQLWERYIVEASINNPTWTQEDFDLAQDKWAIRYGVLDMFAIPFDMDNRPLAKNPYPEDDERL